MTILAAVIQTDQGLSRAEDVHKLARAISLTAQIFFAPGAREVYSAVCSQSVLGDAGAARAPAAAHLRSQEIEMMAFHRGTCAMGEDGRRAATNSFRECHGTRNLYVCDASLFPSSCRVNPQITIMALATRIAAHLAASVNR